MTAGAEAIPPAGPKMAQSRDAGPVNAYRDWGVRAPRVKARQRLLSPLFARLPGSVTIHSTSGKKKKKKEQTRKLTIPQSGALILSSPLNCVNCL